MTTARTSYHITSLILSNITGSYFCFRITTFFGFKILLYKLLFMLCEPFRMNGGIKLFHIHSFIGLNPAVVVSVLAQILAHIIYTNAQ